MKPNRKLAETTTPAPNLDPQWGPSCHFDDPGVFGVPERGPDGLERHFRRTADYMTVSMGKATIVYRSIAHLRDQVPVV